MPFHIDTEQTSTVSSQDTAESAAPVAHTPTPWHASRKSVYVSDSHHNCLAHMLRGRNENQANADFIVKAVNGRQALLARIARLEADLLECREYLETELDVIDGDYGEPAPNRAMALVSLIDETLNGRPV